MLDFLKTTYHRLIAQTAIEHHRYLYSQFNHNQRLSGIIGPRGVGKTTMMLQYIKQHLYDTNSAFYVSADNIYFNQNSLLEFVNELYQNDGVTIFFIDEIHKYNNWDQELKNIYDSFPELNFIFSGSSSIDLIRDSYDLSRRATLKHLYGMSFREYLNFKTGSSLDVVDFNTLLTNPAQLNATIAQIPKVQGHFKDYLQQGYYPFIFEGQESYYERIARIIEKTIYEDISNYYNLKTPNLHFFKKILNYLALNPPGELNTHNIATNLGIDDKTANNYLTILLETGLIKLLYPYAKGSVSLRKPEKIFLDNTSLLYAINAHLGHDVNIGTVRELFFIQTMANSGHNLFYSQLGDFQTEDVVFEIGGKNKTRKQLKPSKLPAYLVKDNIQVASQGELPLHYFGFLY